MLQALFDWLDSLFGGGNGRAAPPPAAVSPVKAGPLISGARAMQGGARLRKRSLVDQELKMASRKKLENDARKVHAYNAPTIVAAPSIRQQIYQAAIDKYVYYQKAKEGGFYDSTFEKMWNYVSEGGGQAFSAFFSGEFSDVGRGAASVLARDMDATQAHTMYVSTADWQFALVKNNPDLGILWQGNRYLDTVASQKKGYQVFIP